MDDLYKRYVAQSTEQLLEGRDAFLDCRRQGLPVDLQAEALLQHVLLTERNIAPVIGGLASLDARMAAKLIDGWVIWLIFHLYDVLPISFLPLPPDFNLFGIIAYAYALLADGLPGGQSLGKRLIGIAVVNPSTRKPCGLLKSALRNSLLYLPLALHNPYAFIPSYIDYTFALIVGKIKRRRLGDVLAATVVVKVANPGKWPFYLIGLMAVAAALGWLALLYFIWVLYGHHPMAMLG